MKIVFIPENRVLSNEFYNFILSSFRQSFSIYLNYHGQRFLLNDNFELVHPEYFYSQYPETSVESALSEGKIEKVLKECFYAPHLYNGEEWVAYLLNDDESKIIAHASGKENEIMFVIVDPDYYNRGLCQYLMTYVFGELKKKYEEFFLHCEGGEPARICYTKAALANNLNIHSKLIWENDRGEKSVTMTFI